MSNANLFVPLGGRASNPDLLTLARKLEIAATVICGIALLLWVAASVSAIAFRNQVERVQARAAAQATHVRLPTVVVVGQRNALAPINFDATVFARAERESGGPATQ